MSLAFTPLAAQDFQKGLAAFEAGDYATALSEWQPLAEQDNPVAQFNLGLMYHNGHGVPQHYGQAVKWCRLAATMPLALGDCNPEEVFTGVVAAQSYLGFMYALGQGVPQDHILSHMWFNIASTNGDTAAAALRDSRADLISDADLICALSMAETCINSGYTKCGP